METIDQAKEFLRENWEKGANCPCCGQSVRLWPRKIHWSMAICLIRLYHLTKQAAYEDSFPAAFDYFFHVNEFGADGTIGGDFAKLAYWGLIEPKESDGKNGSRTSGVWQITEKGIKFVLGNVTVPETAFVFDGKVRLFDGPNVDIKHCLGKKFNYEELISNGGEYEK